MGKYYINIGKIRQSVLRLIPRNPRKIWMNNSRVFHPKSFFPMSPLPAISTALQKIQMCCGHTCIHHACPVASQIKCTAICYKHSFRKAPRGRAVQPGCGSSHHMHHQCHALAANSKTSLAEKANFGGHSENVATPRQVI